MVTSIGESAFYGCRNLSVLTLPSTVSTLESYAFDYCNLKNLVIPEGVETIGDYCFCGTKVVKLEIPSTLTVTGEKAFTDCSKLKAITYAGTKDAAQAIAIGDGNPT